MKKPFSFSVLFLFQALVLASLLFGCGGGYSPEPMPANHAAYVQLKVQAAEHWRGMASEIADRVTLAVQDRYDVRDRGIYVRRPSKNSFEEVFYNFLRTELVSRGLQVFEREETRGLLLDYSVQTVRFDRSRYADQPIYSGSRYAGPADVEMVVSARLATLNRFFMHCSVIRYINDSDFALYHDVDSPALPADVGRRSVRVVNK